MPLEYGNDRLAIVRYKLARELDSGIMLLSVCKHNSVDDANHSEHEFKKATERFGRFEFYCTSQVS
jgi:hypothetical protein